MSGHCPTCGQAGCSSDHYYASATAMRIKFLEDVIGERECRIEELEFQLEEQTKRHILRIAELEATIQSHGIAIKTATGGVAHYCTKETLLDAHAKQVESEGVPCSTHPDAPHGFARDASHSAGRYVCECHGWTPE